MFGIIVAVEGAATPKAPEQAQAKQKSSYNATAKTVAMMYILTTV
jgi:hypothetical protein